MNRLKAVVQLLMACLAVCDIMLLLSVFWIIPTVLDMGWTLGDFMCRLETSFGAMAGDCSMNTIAIIGIDRLVLELQTLCITACCYRRQISLH